MDELVAYYPWLALGAPRRPPARPVGGPDRGAPVSCHPFCHRPRTQAGHHGPPVWAHARAGPWRRRKGLGDARAGETPSPAAAGAG